MGSRVAKSGQVIWHKGLVTREQREAANDHKSAVVWFTGLPGAGKSTIAHEVERKLFLRGCRTFVLDGDNVRHGLCWNLGFSEADRCENIRRVGEVAKLFREAGMIVLCAFVSPMRDSRTRVREIISPDAFVEVYCKCPIEVCEQRDTKGFYARAKKGEIKDYTGISAPYEEPLNPDLVIDTAADTVESCAEQVTQLLQRRRVISPTPDNRTSAAGPDVTPR